MTPATQDDVAAVRSFSRFYTKQIGLLGESLLASPYSLTEGRVIYELAHTDGVTATGLAGTLGLDPGYMSRVLRGLSRRGVLDKKRSESDRRMVFLSLSPAGREAFEDLSASSERQISEILGGLDEARRREVVSAMKAVETGLSSGTNGDEPRAPFALRPHRPGDMGWIVERHGTLYSETHGWGDGFEAMCADICGRFLRDYDPAWERSWIAERDGARVGAVLLVRHSDTVGQLRCLIVDPAARGLGLGARLVSECVGHARHVGFREMVLFTVRGLDSARRLYEAEGFQLVEESPGEGWAEGAIEQRWSLSL